MANCCIRYTATSIFFDFEPGCANFSYWVDRKVSAGRWRRADEGFRVGCEITEEEAVYIEKLARAQWGPDGCAVIGRPAPAVKAAPPKIVKQPGRFVLDPDQLKLFDV